MVRHEAAEALGGIPSDGSDGGTVLQLLREWASKTDAPDVVRDSCVVAVDMWEVCKALHHISRVMLNPSSPVREFRPVPVR